MLEGIAHSVERPLFLFLNKLVFFASEVKAQRARCAALCR
jgi:hypothetical protein